MRSSRRFTRRCKVRKGATSYKIFLDDVRDFLDNFLRDALEYPTCEHGADPPEGVLGRKEFLLYFACLTPVSATATTP